MAVARLSDFSYAYPGARVAALDAVSLSVESEMTLLRGASGSGKSTLLRVFNGIVPHFHGGTVRGTACVFEHDIVRSTTRALARDVGFVFQDPEQQAVYASVERDVAFGLENAMVPRALMLQRVDEALTRYGIAHLRSRAVATLSGGERQRLALAGVLAMRPRLLVLDEPLAQLDNDGAQAFIDALIELRDSGTAILIAEHRVEHLGAIASHVLSIDHGRVNAASLDEAHGSTASLPAANGARRAATSSWSIDGVAAAPGRAEVLAGVHLQGGGDVVALTGPNGGGKTTLLRTIAGLLPPVRGSATRSAARVAYLPQNPAALLHRPTVRDEIEWTCRHARPRDDVDSMLDLFHLRHVADRYPRDLSTGERQRAALAAVMAGEPDLVLLDEPTRGMDAVARAALRASVELARARGGSVVVATHDAELIRQLAGRVAHVGGGAVREIPVAQNVPEALPA